MIIEQPPSVVHFKPSKKRGIASQSISLRLDLDEPSEISGFETMVAGSDVGVGFEFTICSLGGEGASAATTGRFITGSIEPVNAARGVDEYGRET